MPGVTRYLITMTAQLRATAATYHILDNHRRHVLPAGRDQDLLDPPRDGEVSVIIHHPDIARVVPPVTVEHLPCSLLRSQIAHEDIATSHTQFPGSRRYVTDTRSIFVQSGVEAGQVSANGTRPENEYCHEQ